jgi:hypothetical protein
MAEIIRIPAGLNITCGIGDVLKLELNFKLNGVTFDLSGWTLEGENVAVQVLDAPNGLIELTFNEDVSKLGQWYLRRVTPTSKRLLAGFIQFVSTANVSTSLDPIQIDILDSPDLTIDIFSGEKGDKGDQGDQGRTRYTRSKAKEVKMVTVLLTMHKQAELHLALYQLQRQERINQLD